MRTIPELESGISAAHDRLESHDHIIAELQQNLSELRQQLQVERNPMVNTCSVGAVCGEPAPKRW